MSLPDAVEARFFYQAAKQRLEDARFLFEAERTTGSVYLAGYAIECMLKAMTLNQCSKSKRRELHRSFRGSKAHDFEWPKRRYFDNGGPMFPRAVSRAFSFVSTWEVDFRYRSGTVKYAEAKTFLECVDAITAWAEGRM